MLPTPTASHLTFNHIYKLSDDTFLLQNTLTHPIPRSTLPLSANLLPPSSPQTRQRNFSARSENYKADCYCQSYQGEGILSRGYKDGFSGGVEVRSGGYAGD
ncbi:hypothetical protein HOY80DRAFT_971226 [Tuber brumale]|nr:hypothetical protein HOY80DRAFT_971226 [Tuber brumale]